MCSLPRCVTVAVAVLFLGASPSTLAATPACFAPAHDGSGIGALHLLTADPLEIGTLTDLKVTRAGAFFRDRDLASITAERVDGGVETQLTFTFTSQADYEILINRTVHMGQVTSEPSSRAYLIRYRYCVRGGRLLTASPPYAAELTAADEALQVLRKLLASNKMLPDIQVAEVVTTRTGAGL